MQKNFYIIYGNIDSISPVVKEQALKELTLKFPVPILEYMIVQESDLYKSKLYVYIKMKKRLTIFLKLVI